MPGVAWHRCRCAGHGDVCVLMALQGGKTVLHYSSESGNAELVEMLLGVDGIHDVNLADKVGHA